MAACKIFELYHYIVLKVISQISFFNVASLFLNSISDATVGSEHAIYQVHLNHYTMKKTTTQ